MVALVAGNLLFSATHDNIVPWCSLFNGSLSLDTVLISPGGGRGQGQFDVVAFHYSIMIALTVLRRIVAHSLEHPVQLGLGLGAERGAFERFLLVGQQMAGQLFDFHLQWFHCTPAKTTKTKQTNIIHASCGPEAEAWLTIQIDAYGSGRGNGDVVVRCLTRENGQQMVSGQWEQGQLVCGHLGKGKRRRYFRNN